MSADRPSIPLSRLRDLLAARVETCSIRSVAREVGLPPNGLDYFLKGGEPRTANRRKLEQWFVQQAAQGTGSVGAEAGDAALDVLLRVLPPASREEGRDRLVKTLRELCTEAGVHPPAWVKNEKAKKSGPASS
jgi:hypothetical protein